MKEQSARYDADEHARYHADYNLTHRSTSPAFFGLALHCWRFPVLTFTQCTVRDAVLSFVSCTAFEAFAEKHPELCQSLLRLLADRMRERDKMLAATSFLKIKGRIAHTLLELAEHFGEEVEPGRIVICQQNGKDK